MIERSPERDAALDALLPLVPERGWTVAALREAAGEDADLLFPGVAVEMAEAWSDLADRRMEEQVCIGESCSRCLHSCPPDAVKQWGLDKAGCATEAQEFGYMTITNFMSRFIDMPTEEQKTAVRSRDLFGFWQGLLRVVGSFGDCPRCR